jgi:alanyl-tRNA synthetase
MTAIIEGVSKRTFSVLLSRKELIEKYLKFFKSKGHKEIKNSSLIPENDPTVLFTTAGMHPLVPFLLGQKHPQGKRLVNIQRCIRTGDIDLVGDETHHTFFEMLGNWSLGDYFKEESIKFSDEFLTEQLKLPIEKLAVTCFIGEKESKIPKDEEAAKIWQDLGIKKERIAFLPREDNWWGPAGQVGPCGPDTEIFFWTNSKTNPPAKFNPKDKSWVEIWNNVFMQYTKDEKSQYKEAPQKNIDTGMGVERTLTALNNFDDAYQTEVFLPIIESIEDISGYRYKEKTKEMRIIADHLKASVFLIADGITPSNTLQGYVLRRLIRRAIIYGHKLEMKNFLKKLVSSVFDVYKDDYPMLKENSHKILEELEKEENKFLLTLEKGMGFFNKLVEGEKKLSGEASFLLFQSYGFPLEMTKELAKEKNILVDEKGFEKEMKKHQELSRTASQGMFKSGLADNSEQTTKLHTATHLLNEALREVLKDKNIMQKGSNITPERLRFDFSFDRKLTDKEIQAVENLVNKKISEKLEIKKEEMSPEQAKKSGAHGVFDSKYKDKVSVYSIGSFSKEICAGPHISNTKELGKFKIQKEESSSAGVRRIKAVLE